MKKENYLKVIIYDSNIIIINFTKLIFFAKPQINTKFYISECNSFRTLKKTFYFIIIIQKQIGIFQIAAKKKDLKLSQIVSV